MAGKCIEVLKATATLPGAAAEHTMSRMLGTTVGLMFAEDDRVVALDADVGFDGLLGRDVLARFPGRFLNVGIAEANMIGVACGLSYSGKIPFTHTFGCFASRRVFDQVFLSGAFGGAHVKMIGSMPGITAEINGGTHMSFDDLAVMRAIPEMTILEPSDWVQGEQALRLAKNTPGMFYIRWERKGTLRFYESGSRFEIGRSVILRDGAEAAIFALGHLCVKEALEAAAFLAQDGIECSVVDVFSLKPLDIGLVLRLAHQTGCFVSVENHSVVGGLGSALAEALAKNIPVPLEMMGIQDRFGEVGDLESLKEEYHLTARDIAQAVRQVLSRKHSI